MKTEFKNTDEIKEFLKLHNPKKEIIQMEPFEIYIQDEIKFKNDDIGYKEYSKILKSIKKGAEDMARIAGQPYSKLDKFRMDFFEKDKSNIESLLIEKCIVRPFEHNPQLSNLDFIEEDKNYYLISFGFVSKPLTCIGIINCKLLLVKEDDFFEIKLGPAEKDRQFI